VALERFLADYHVERGVSLPIQPLFAEALKRGQALVMLDGLDEIKDPVCLRKHVVDQVLVLDDYAVVLGAGRSNGQQIRTAHQPHRRLCRGAPDCRETGRMHRQSISRTKTSVQFVDQWTQVIEQLAHEQSIRRRRCHRR
jgi:predicted NACHT family NTPase